MSNDEFVQVASLANLPQGRCAAVAVADREILLCHTADGVFALDNLCTHGAARLCEGKLKGNRVLCPLHGAAFDVRDGSALSRPAVRGLASYRVKVTGDAIAIAVTD
ncbi:non-heme iron oxygenase ferredoxin subunit [Seongchinamella unica]|uniref:Non-heme iron oxygenase ferredoxin subunit n=1 Tax=Seongchinamella unica TaxID=2547392 RepID=A0A4V2ZXG0_9GAMM|nr:non-heme iron oxygenase ferredoxin subunit [Seongchinamella unica]TDG14875.1 non-heme iron oxygenase ferredoxin subunit [Seongchinamella unica]